MLKRIIGLLFPPCPPAPHAFLKATGSKIIVDVQDCTIITSSFYEESAGNDGLEVHILDGLVSYRTGDFQEREICYLSCVYQTAQHTHMEMLSPYIYKDRMTVNFLLERHKQISIYLNPVDCREYYFDLEFMNV
ncbi:hypothetical protein [Chitinophaga rhizophila]|uniref:Uncharacterized protein n=1 Tax=Chitinophaga rhizophila TaxID=2866212 RepID=A0ABS7GL92_9BACT|nr:hypothetical protein [Chitinophaga rhizophila]MBW8687524.1 hypothetical protein [Chitinophaga rhizophila]